MPDDLSDADRESIREALTAGRKIDAIRIYRGATNAGLAEAKVAVEAIEAGVMPGTSAPALPSDDVSGSIRAELLAGRKIHAIKAYRERTGCGLKEAKDAVEAIEANLRRTSPSHVAASHSKTGCLPVVLVVGAGFCLVALWLRH